jgi:magnesium transporter
MVSSFRLVFTYGEADLSRYNAMSSPPGDALPTSPMSIRIAHRDGSPAHRRGSSPRDPSPTVQRNRSGSENHERGESPTLVRHSPSVARANYNPLDPEVRERQRTLDADMAMHLSRARRSSVSSSPVMQTSFHEHDHRQVPHDLLQHEHLHHEDLFPTFSLQEERDLESARRGPEDVDDVTGLLHDESTVFHRSPSPEIGGLPHLSQAHDPALLAGPQSFYHPAAAASHDISETGLPMYQPPAMTDRQAYKFTFMEEFAREEKARLGLASPNEEHPAVFRKRTNTSAGGEAGPSTSATAADFTLPPARPVRERKLSHSNTVPRRQGGKMALFEAAVPPAPPLLIARAPHLGVPASLPPVGSATSSVEALPHTHPVHPILPAAGGHDRPYRFSFFSNALAATIHARSLSELPAEGQSFEDMFLAGGAQRSPPNESAPSSIPRSSVATPPFPPDVKAVNGARAGIGGTALNGDIESHTWWLDVLSPTDEEMKMLTQVRVRPYSANGALSL